MTKSKRKPKPIIYKTYWMINKIYFELLLMYHTLRQKQPNIKVHMSLRYTQCNIKSVINSLMKIHMLNNGR